MVHCVLDDQIFLIETRGDLDEGVWQGSVDGLLDGPVGSGLLI
jgi:hypothetical protein